MADLSKLSDADLLALQNGNLKQLSDEGLNHLSGSAPPLRVEAAGQASDEPRPVPIRGVFSQMGHQVGLTGRALVTGLSSLPNMAGDALNSGINLATGGINSLAGTDIPKLNMPSEATQNLMTQAGVSVPENQSEQRAQAIASSMASAAPSMAIGKLLAGTTKPVAQAIGTTMQQAPGMQVVAGGSGALGQQLAAENGAGFGGQLAASLFGGMTGAGLASGVTAAVKGLGAPSKATLIADALKQYEANNAPEVIKPRYKLNADGTQTLVTEPPKTFAFEPPVKPEEGVRLSTDKQIKNIETMKKIGLNNQRPSAITGDKFTAGQEYENGKLANETGLVARTQLAKEQDALKNFAGQIIHNTGAKVGTPEAAGQTIRAPLQALSDHFDTEIGKLYDAAKQNAGELGAVEPKNLNKLIQDPDFRESLLSSPQGTTLLGSIERQVKRFQGLPVPSEADTLPVVKGKAPKVEASPEFNEWFGNSQAVDKKGKPLVVYHGSPAPEFSSLNEAEKGLYFTDKKAVAEGYKARPLKRGLEGSVSDAHLSMQNPLVLDALGKKNTNIPVPWQDWKPTVFGRRPDNAVSIEDAFKYAVEQGHDGLIVKNVVDNYSTNDPTKSTAYVVAKSNQTKLLKANNVQPSPLAPDTQLGPAPRTVNSAENLRKWLNSQWSPGNSKLIGNVKEALDSDVANAGGSGVFDSARKLHGLRKDTLDNPNGISALLESDGPKGINQKVADETVGRKVMTMPTGQFEHVLGTLKNLPDHLQEAGQSAISEIKAAFAKKIYDAGDSGGTQNGPSIWNAANVTRELKANQSKMNILFSPEEMEAFNTLHDAGHILQTPMAYKGAAAQGYNYLQAGTLTGLPAAGAGLGALLGGPIGSMTGTAIGAGLSKGAQSKINASMATKYAELLKNPVPNVGQ